MLGGGHPQGTPECDLVHDVSTQMTSVSSFSKCKGNPWQHGFCDSGTQGWTASCCRDEIEQSASITTHPSLRQSLQNAR